MLQKKIFLNYLAETCWNLSSSRLFHFKGDDSLTLYETEFLRLGLSLGKVTPMKN